MTQFIPLPVADLVAAYEAGATGDVLAARYGVSRHTVLNCLRRAGVRIRSKGGRPPIYDRGWTQAFVEAYQRGEPIGSIAGRMGAGKGTVWRALLAAEVVRRPKGMRPATITPPTDPATLGYFAGLFDGEGNLAFQPRHAGSSINVKLTVYNTHPGVMAWLTNNIGGVVRWDHKRVERAGGLPLGIWALYRARNIELLLRATLPYLVIKRETAEAALAIFAKVFAVDHGVGP